MRILLLVTNIVGVGTYRRAFQVGRHLVQHGCEVTLVATSPSQILRTGEETVDGVRVVQMPDLLPRALRSGWDLWNSLSRIFWLRGRDFDLVHAFESRPTVILPTLYLHYLRRVPVILDWADWFGKGGSVEERQNAIVRALVRPVETVFENSFRAWADGTTVICSTLRQKAISLGVRADSILMLPNGCNIEQFYPQDMTQARQRLGMITDSPVIGYLGSLFHRDAELMARSFDLVSEQMPGARLLIIGNCKVDVRKQVREPLRVIQTGYVPERALNDYLAAADVFWLPLSDTNANRGRWPLKLNDYMAAGRATVATAVGDVTALFDREPIGVLASDQSEHFARQTVSLLSQPELSVAMGKRARQVAETKFSWLRITSDLATLYDRTIVHNIATGTKR